MNLNSQLSNPYPEEEKFSTTDSFTSASSPTKSLFYSEYAWYQTKKDFEKATISITPTHLILHQSSTSLIHYDDIFGVTIRPMEGHEKKNMSLDLALKISVFILHYSIKDTKTLKRTYLDTVLYFESFPRAWKWRNIILNLAHDPNFRSQLPEDFPNSVPEFSRRLLVFINPICGNKVALTEWQKAKKWLESAGYHAVEVVTKRRGDCEEQIYNADASYLKSFFGIIAVSGDGLPHELVNGIFKRPDWKEISKIPMGVIPCGSGNGVAASVVKRSKELYSFKNFCYIIAKGRTTKADLTCLETIEGQRIFYILLFHWALFADVVIESEKLRPLGRRRYDLIVFKRLLVPKKCKCRFSYITSNDSEPLPSVKEDLPKSWTTITDTFNFFCIYNMAFTSDRTDRISLSELDDGYNHYYGLKGPNSNRRKLLKVLMNFSKGIFDENGPKKSLSFLHDAKIKAFRIETEDSKPASFSVDGELYDSSKLQGVVMERVLTLFCK